MREALAMEGMTESARVGERLMKTLRFADEQAMIAWNQKCPQKMMD